MNNDAPRLRRALGQFATGVTVVTAPGPSGPGTATGTAAGVTINSFTSVSLDPPLVLWCLDRTASSLPLFRDAGHFCINVLSDRQKHLCERFAATGGNQFDGLDFAPGLGGAPRFEGCLAWFECARHAGFDGGDHAILLGRVERFGIGAGSPLVFFDGAFPELGIVGKN